VLNPAIPTHLVEVVINEAVVRV